MEYLHISQGVAAMYLVYHPDYLEHNKSISYHPESPQRLLAIINYLKEKKLWDREKIIRPASAEKSDILLCHTERLIKQVKTLSEKGGIIDADTPVGVGTYDIALRAVGGTIKACQIAIEHNDSAFAFVRPPGHHAERDRACGFCYFNNVAIAAEKVLLTENINKILILDIDVHHGNGTQDIFYTRNDVFYISLHQHPHTLYPGTGFPEETGGGAGKGFTANIALPPATDDDNYIYAFEKIVLPAINRFKPELIIVSAGFDTHRKDPLASLNLTEKTYEFIALKLKESAVAVVFSLEGGYDTYALSHGSESIINVFEEKYTPDPPKIENISEKTKAVISSLKKYLKL